MKQIDFGFFGKVSREFGGSLLKGKRKVARPIVTSTPMHLVLKSSGSSYFHAYGRAIEKIILTHAKDYGVKVYDITSNYSHIHLTILLRSRKCYLDFIRTVTAAIVRFLSTQKGVNLKGLFDLRPYTRILSWGRQMKVMRNYHEINEMESFGIFVRNKKTQKKTGSRSPRRA